MPVSRASLASQAPGPAAARCGLPIDGVIAVAAAAGSGTASAEGARVGCSGQSAVPGLAGGPELAAAAGGGMNDVMGVDDPAGPGRDSGAVQTGGPLAAALTGWARSGSALGESCAGRDAASQPEPGVGRNEPLVSGDDDQGLPAARAAAGGATADPVKDYLKQIGKVPLLNAGQEVELAKRIEAGLFADRKLAAGAGVLRAGLSRDLERVAEDGRRAKDHLVEANLRLVVSLARRYVGRGCCSWT